MNPGERRARLSALADVAERSGWRELFKWCIKMIARMILAEAAR